MSVEHLMEDELNAFIDGQLDAKGRVEVQDYLARHPDLAARVMADLGVRDSLRLAISAQPATRADTVVAARRLSGALSRRRYIEPLRRLAAGIAIFALGWTASHGWDRVANRGQTTAAIPGASSVEASHILANAPAPFAGVKPASAVIDVSHLDPVRLGAAVSVKLPRIPAGWEVIGTRIVDSEDGAGVEVMMKTPEFGELSLFARHTKDVAIVLPTVEKGEEESTAYWQLVSDSYALTGHLPRKPLEFAALELFQTLY